MKIQVSAEPLRRLLEALVGPGHLIRELQATRRLEGNPITALVDEYNEMATGRQSNVDEQDFEAWFAKEYPLFNSIKDSSLKLALKRCWLAARAPTKGERT